jgi:hypothetical protein
MSYNGKWYGFCVSVYNDCPEVTDVCKWHLLVVQDENEIRFHPDLSVEFNSYKYSIEQVCTVLLCNTKSVNVEGFYVWKRNHQ